MLITTLVVDTRQCSVTGGHCLYLTGAEWTGCTDRYSEVLASPRKHPVRVMLIFFRSAPTDGSTVLGLKIRL